MGDCALHPGFLLGDGKALFDGQRIVRANFAADAILERRDDFAARGVIFRIGREHQHDVERQADRVAFDLHVAFLHDVEQSHLDLAGEIGQFVDGENAAIGARQQSIVDRHFAGELVPAARGLDGIDVADHVGDGDVGRCQFFHVAMVAVEPSDGRLVALLGDQVAAAAANGMKRIVANFAAGDVRQALVEQPGEHADDASFGLPAQSQQDEIVARQNGVDDLRNHGIFVADHAGEKLVAALQLADQILAQLAFYGPLAEMPLAKFAVFQGSESRG